MRKKKEGARAHDLRDVPVPLVENRSEGRGDAVGHPEAEGRKGSLDDTIIFNPLQ